MKIGENYFEFIENVYITDCKCFNVSKCRNVYDGSITFITFQNIQGLFTNSEYLHPIGCFPTELDARHCIDKFFDELPF